MKFKTNEQEYFKKFTHKKCEYFPCHQTSDPDNFNCLFCYCPLYTLGTQCGGNFTYTNNIKDCSNCILPHSKDGYAYVVNNYERILSLASSTKKADDYKPSSTLRHAYIKLL